MAEWAVSLKHKHIGIRGGKTITEGGRDDRVTDKLSTGHLSRLSHNVLPGATIGSSHLWPRIPLPSLHMEAIRALYSHTNISLIILIVMPSLISFH